MVDKSKIIDALNRWVSQRPGLDYGNYGDPVSYRAEVRSIGKDLQHARAMINYVAWHDSITAESACASSSKLRSPSRAACAMSARNGQPSRALNRSRRITRFPFTLISITPPYSPSIRSHPMRHSSGIEYASDSRYRRDNRCAGFARWHPYR